MAWMGPWDRGDISGKTGEIGATCEVPTTLMSPGGSQLGQGVTELTEDAANRTRGCGGANSLQLFCKWETIPKISLLK